MTIIQLLNDKRKRHSAVLLALALFALLSVESEARAQSTATNYVWADSIRMSGTNAKDSLFSILWEDVTIKASGTSGYFKFGSPDTTSWISRSWILLEDGESIRFGPGTRLRRMQFKGTASGLVVFMIGYKKTAQF